MTPKRLAEIRDILESTRAIGVVTNQELTWLLAVLDRQEKEIERLTAENAALRERIEGYGGLQAQVIAHVERIAAQGNLLTRRAVRPAPPPIPTAWGDVPAQTDGTSSAAALPPQSLCLNTVQ